MASTGLTSPKNRSISKLRLVLYGISVFLILALAWLAYNYQSLKGQANVATAYGSHIACSCRYIAGREMDNCKRDFEPGMEMLSVVDDPTRKRVTASIPFLAQATAERRGTYGCIVLNDDEIKAE